MLELDGGDAGGQFVRSAITLAALSGDPVRVENVRERDGFEVIETTVSSVETDSPGSVCLVRADHEHAIAGFDALGEKGKPAETVGEEAVESFVAFEGNSGAVDRHMADQLLVFLAVAGGAVAIPAVTDHVRTSVDLLATFGHEVTIAERETGAVLTAQD